MGKIDFSNSILKKGIVVKGADYNKNTVRIQMSDGCIDIPAYSPKSKGHKDEDHLRLGEEVILKFIKNEFEHTASGIRQHALATIFYPHDKEYEKVLELEKNPHLKEEHPVEIAFQKLK